jgi:hypothetical protein
MTPQDFASWLRPGWYISVMSLDPLHVATLWRPAGDRASQGFRIIAEHDFSGPDDPALPQWVAALDTMAASGVIIRPRPGWLWMLPHQPPGFAVDELLGPDFGTDDFRQG